MDRQLVEIAKNFSFRGDPVEATPCSKGHINDTYVLRCVLTDGGRLRYILQRIDHHIFRNPEKMMENIAGVTEHLRRKILLAGGDPRRETLTIIPPRKGGNFLRTDSGDYWRAYDFIENTHSRDIVENPKQFYLAGRLLGKFQGLLSDFPIERLHETIPDFHNTKKRFEQFITAVEKDNVNHARRVKDEIDFVIRRESDTATLVDLIAGGKLSPRVAHNDTKFNNMMIDDATGECVCLVDLDTVMPGLYLYDFGDSIRTGATTAPEDEKNLARVSMDLGLFEHFTRGYIESAGSFLSDLELELLPRAAKLMTFESGMRFLADYLNGDIYFKVHRPEHNLDRARTQFKLVADMEEKMDRMIQTVAEITEAEQHP
ncbi:MAG: aminoglycoside phosphotransferase family protein [Spirochaetales bacterium]|nr:aminoglycoside phosphotransferase family protein [Spirochaetales bacterium]